MSSEGGAEVIRKAPEDTFCEIAFAEPVPDVRQILENAFEVRRKRCRLIKSDRCRHEGRYAHGPIGNVVVDPPGRQTLAGFIRSSRLR